jgi:hypothetical protein
MKNSRRKSLRYFLTARIQSYFVEKKTFCKQKVCASLAPKLLISGKGLTFLACGSAKSALIIYGGVSPQRGCVL